MKNTGFTPFGRHRWYAYVMGSPSYSDERFDCIDERDFSCYLTYGLLDERVQSRSYDCLVMLRPDIKQNGGAESFVQYAHGLRQKYGLPVVLAHVSDVYREDFLQHGVDTYEHLSGRRRNDTKGDAQNFPEVIIKTDEFLTGKTENVYTGLKKALRDKGSTYGLYKVNGDSDVHLNEIAALYEEWGKKRISKGNIPNHKMIKDSVCRIKGGNKQELYLVRDVNYKLVSFFHILETSPIQRDIAQTICLRRENNLHKFLYRRVIGSILDSNSNIKYINLGGSETEALFVYKKSIWPDHIKIACSNYILTYPSEKLKAA